MPQIFLYQGNDNLGQLKHIVLNTIEKKVNFGFHYIIVPNNQNINFSVLIRAKKFVIKNIVYYGPSGTSEMHRADLIVEDSAICCRIVCGHPYDRHINPHKNKEIQNGVTYTDCVLNCPCKSFDL